LVKSEPIQDCIIIEGGILMTRWIVGTHCHISSPRLRKLVPLSRAGAVIRIIERLSPLLQVRIARVRLQSGRTIFMESVARLELPRRRWSALSTTSVAVSSAAEAAKTVAADRDRSAVRRRDLGSMATPFCGAMKRISGIRKT
jgi:hypothetical protein